MPQGKPTQIAPPPAEPSDEDASTFKFVTYTLTNKKTGQVYVGRTSGYGTPKQIVQKRFNGHHMEKKGFANPTPVNSFRTELPKGNFRTRKSDPAYYKSRSAEDDNIITNKALGVNGNAIKGISDTNNSGQTYKDSYNNVRDHDNCADCHK